MSRCIVILVTLVSLTACTAVDLPRPAPGALFSPRANNASWPDDPAAVAVQLYSPYTTAGLSGAYDERYYIPEVRIWSDGRIVWVERDGHTRRVLEGRLTEEEMDALLDRIVSAGFFEWERDYYTVGGHSASPMYLLVNVADRSKEIREHGGAPEAYYELEAFLQSGAGAEGHNYVPTRGYVTLQKLDRNVGGAPWPSDAKPTPEEIGEGRYVEGEVLRFVWEQVNRHPTGPVYVEHNDTGYIAMVQVPLISYFEPPPVE